MATFTKKDAETFYAQPQRRENIRFVLSALENILIAGRDEDAIPIYLTKQRIKSVNSLYLKTKRKDYESLDEVTDVAGLRVLCLFEQDILTVHEYLVGILSSGKYRLTEFKIYNWPDDNYIEELQNIVKKLKSIVKKHFPKHNFKDPTKGSGYKSIHYVATKDISGVPYPIEIQLRTLFQDVWGELEHSLAYKQGNIHPHIKQSFQLLSKDLENMDTLVSQLRTIRDREYDIGLFALKEGGPSPPFGYEEDWLSQVFTQGTPIENAAQEYTAYIERERDYFNLRGWADKAFQLYEAVEQLLEAKDMKKDNVQYWRLMERAYVLFVLSEYDDAKELYTEATKKWKEWYMPYFRLGELHFIKGEVVHALELFDSCEKILLELDEENKVDPLTYVRLEGRLAEMYWLLGEQYYAVALRKMQKVEEIYNKHSEKIPTDSQTRLERAIANNLCWFYLEVYILAREKHEQGKDVEDRKYAEWAYGEASKKYSELEMLMNKLKDKRANDYDTAAWFCYQTFLRDRKTRSLLEKAKEYCSSGWGLKINALQVIHSSYLYRRHTQDILSAYQRSR